MVRFPWGAVVVCAAGVALTFCFSVRREQAHARMSARADSLATENAALRVRELGYQTTLEHAGKTLTLKDSALASALEAARARPVAQATIQATAQGSVQAQAEPVVEDSVAVGAEAYFVDGPLSGRLAYVFDPPAFGLDWRLDLRGELVAAEMPDGRLMVAARSEDPRVVLHLPELVWAPPPAPKGPSRLRWLVVGAALGVIGWEVAR